jgi:hypothetical protein
MNNWARWSPVTGILFVALWLVAFAVTDGSPDSGDSDAKIVAYYADSGHRARDIVGLFLILAASLLFLWFLASLRSRLARAEGRAGALTAAAFGAGLVSSVLWFVAIAVFVAPSFARAYSGMFRLAPETISLL